MTDTTLSLAARLAANLIVDAINLAKPGARLAGKIGDRALNLIGGPAFSERDAQRFLLGGADALNKAEAQVDSLDPWYSDGGPTEFLGATYPVNPLDHHRWANEPLWTSQAPEFNTMPNWQAPQSSAPVAPKPTDVAGSPGSASAPPLPGVDPGHLNQPVGAGVAPGTDGLEAAVYKVLAAHHPRFRDDGTHYCTTLYGCKANHNDRASWREHIIPLILAALNPQK